MNFFKSFFTNSVKEYYFQGKLSSLSETSGYKDVFKFFIKVILICSIIATISFSIWTLRPIINGFKEFVNIISQNYPQDLVFTIENGIASSSPAIYEIPFPQELKTKIDSERNILTFIKINTNEELMEKAFPDILSNATSANSLAYVWKKGLAFKDGQKVEVMPFYTVKKLVLTKQTVGEKLAYVLSNIKYIAPILAIVIFFGLFIATIFYSVFWTFISSLIILFAQMFTKGDKSFSNIFKLTLLAILPVIVLNTISQLVINIFIPGYLILILTVLSSFYFIYGFSGKDKEGEKSVEVNSEVNNENK